jgi:hypothetical protein
MSVASMASVAYARRADVEPVNQAPSTPGEVAATKGLRPEAATTIASTQATVTTYIPTEVLTVYVAVLAALAGSTTNAGWAALVGFLIATPIVVWLSYAAQVKTAKGHLPTALQEWPRWEMLFGSIAFLAWAFALPQTPFAGFKWYTPAIAGVAVLIISTGLGLLAPIVPQMIVPASAASGAASTPPPEEGSAAKGPPEGRTD